MHTPHKKKIFVKSQIPQYIREEYPLFLEIMEQYYDFLDQEAGKIVAVKVIEGGSGYNPVYPWAGNTTYEKGSRFSFNNKVYQVIETKTSTAIDNTFNINNVNGTSEYVVFGTNHGLATGDEIIYSFNGATGPAGSTGVIGLVDGSTYWIKTVSPTTVQIFNTRSGALAGATGALVNLTSTGISQTHKFTAGPWHSGATGIQTFANITSKYISTGEPNPVIVYFQVKSASGEYINDPDAGTPNGASAYPVIESGVVKKVVVTDFGSDYTEDDEPIAIITGGGGSGCELETVATLKYGNINSAVAAAKSSRDIDESIELFVDSLRKEFSPKIPEKLYKEIDNSNNIREVDAKKFIKFIKQFYNSKGAEKSIKFLFRILFNSDVQLYYPKLDMLRVSDGKWTQDKTIRITPNDLAISEEDFTSQYLGEKIIGVTSGTTAVIESISDISITLPTTTFELKLTDISGEFAAAGEDIKVYNLDNTMDEIPIGTIRPCIVGLNIIDGGINYSIGDQIITDNSFLARVTATEDVESEPKFFDISNIQSDLYRSFNTSSYVNSTSNTITFKTPHNFQTGDELTYTFNTLNKTPIKDFDIVDDIDFFNECIKFDSSHLFRNGDRVIYSFNGATGPAGSTGPIGLVDDASYYVATTIPNPSARVARVNITNAGSGYGSTPIVTFSNPFTGATSFVGATGSSIGSTGFNKFTQIQVNFAIPGATGVASKFYKANSVIADSTNVPLHSTGTVSNWQFIGRNALGTAVLDSGTVSKVLINDPGFGYGQTPTVSFSGGSPSVAAEAECQTYSDISGKFVRLYYNYASAVLAGSTGLVPISQTNTSDEHRLYLAPIGLKYSQNYYARITGATGVQLYKTQSDALFGSTGALIQLGATGLSEFHVLYNAQVGAFINPTSKTITFMAPHKFKTGRKLVYSFNGSTGPAGASGVLGLVDGETYYARITGATGVQLYTTYEGAVDGATGLIVSLGATGLHQIHKFTQVSTSSITDYKIENYGFNYNETPTEFLTTGGSGSEFTGILDSLIEYDGAYIGTDSQPSSSKKIQDSEYYQDFSYEIISDQSANIFGKLLEQTIHPAGLRYFSKILSVKEESLYDNRYNYNPFYYQYTYFVEGEPRDDFDITDLLDNGTEWTAGDSVAVGTSENPTKIFIRVDGFDYVFIVSESGMFGSTPPAIMAGEQTNGTAKLLFLGVAERLLSVYVNGVLQELNVDYYIFDANTVKFYAPLPVGSIVRIYKLEETPFDTEYQEYIKTYTTIVIRRNKFVRDPFVAYKWYPGVSTTPVTWEANTAYAVDDVIEWLGNYYIVTESGTTSDKPPIHELGYANNGTCVLRWYNYFRGYVGDIVYHNTNFYKVVGTTNANISGIYGQTGPNHVSGEEENGRLVLAYYDPGFSFWVASTAYDLDDVILHQGNWYKVVQAGTSGLTGPTHEFGTQSNGTLMLEYHSIDHDSLVTIPVVSELDPGKAMLGPTVNDIVRNVNTGIPDYFQDLIGTASVTPSAVLSSVTLSGSGNAGLSEDDDEYINYTIIITFVGGTSDGIKNIRRVTNYTGSTKTVTLSASVTIPGDCTTISYRLLQNYMISSVSGSTSVLGLSSFDPAYNLNAIVKKEYSFDPTTISGNAIFLYTGATGLGFPGATGYAHGLNTGDKLVYHNVNGATGITGLTSGTKYYVTKINDYSIKLATNYDNAVASSNIALVSGSTGIHKLYLENNVYPYFNLLITSGGGVGSVLNITEYNEIENTITYTGTPSGTIVANESTYFVYPDLYNVVADNDDYFAGSVVDLVVSSGGAGYSLSDTISISGGYGSGAAASISSVDGSGRITAVTLTNSGQGYIYDPRVTVISTTGNGASIYPILRPITGSDVGGVFKHSMYGHYKFTISDTVRTTTGTASSGSFFVTLDSNFDASTIRPGMIVSGSGITNGTKITNVDVVDNGLTVTNTIKLDTPTTSAVNNTLEISSKRPYPNFEYGETVSQVSVDDPELINKARVIKCDYINNILYVEKSENSDELNNTNPLTRDLDNSTIEILAGEEMYSGWKSINTPVGSIIKSYPL